MKFFKEHWLIFLTSVIYIGKTLLFFYQVPDFILLWDWPGHIEKARVATWPWNGGWDTSFWGGYPTMLYPNLFHWLLKISMTLFSNAKRGAEVAIILLFLLQFHALYLFLKRTIAGKKSVLIRNIAFLAVVTYMSLQLNGPLMGSFLGTLWVGGGPGALGTALWLYLLATNNLLLAGVLMGLLFLTHPLSALVGIIYFGAAVIRVVFQKKLKLFYRWGIALMISAAIGLPWIMSSSDSSSNSIAGNFSTDSSVIAMLSIVLLLFIAFQGKRHWSRWLSTGIIIGIICILPTAVWSALQDVGIRGIQPFRFWWYQWILTIPLFFSWIDKEQRIRLWFHHVNKATIGLITVLLAMWLVTSSQLKQTTFLTLNFLPIEHLHGRVMNTSGAAAGLDYSQAMEHSIVEKTHLIGATRWLYESGSLGYLYYSLKVAIDPKSFNDGTSKLNFLFPDGKPLVPIDVKQTADLLGVNYYLFTSDEEQSDPNILKIGEFRISQPKGEPKILPYYMKKISDEALVTTLPTLPDVDPNADLMTWWKNTDHKTLVTDEEYRESSNVDLGKPTVRDIDVKPTQISFFVEGNRPAPVFVKFSYSPYWEAKVLKGQGSVSKPYWITPGNMLVYGYGHIQLNWRTPWYMRVFAPFSTAFAIVCALTLLMNRWKPMRSLQLE